MREQRKNKAIEWISNNPLLCGFIAILFLFWLITTSIEYHTLTAAKFNALENEIAGFCSKKCQNTGNGWGVLTAPADFKSCIRACTQ